MRSQTGAAALETGAAALPLHARSARIVRVRVAGQCTGWPRVQACAPSGRTRTQIRRTSTLTESMPTDWSDFDAPRVVGFGAVKNAAKAW